MVLSYLASCDNEARRVFPSRQTIATALHRSTRWVDYHLARAQALGFVRILRRGRKQTNRYLLADLGPGWEQMPLPLFQAVRTVGHTALAVWHFEEQARQRGAPRPRRAELLRALGLTNPWTISNARQALARHFGRTESVGLVATHSPKSVGLVATPQELDPVPTRPRQEHRADARPAHSRVTKTERPTPSAYRPMLKIAHLVLDDRDAGRIDQLDVTETIKTIAARAGFAYQTTAATAYRAAEYQRRLAGGRRR